MKLSEALMLATTLKLEAYNWNHCALGASATSVGVKEAIPELSPNTQFPSVMLDRRHRYIHIVEIWPWLQDYHKDHVWLFNRKVEYMSSITYRFDCEVCQGRMTIEQLADYIKSVEPECGECNRFECTCVREDEPVNVEIPSSVR